MSGNWANLGSFSAGSGAVNFVDAPSCVATTTPSIISGSTTFATLSLVSSAGKPFQLAAGSTQTILSQLTMIGTPALAIRVQSTVPGQFANLNLVGTQTISDVAAADIAGTGRYLAPFVVNRNPNGVVINGFGDPNPAVPVATLSQSLLIALSALLLLVGIRAQRFQRRTKNQNV